MRFIINVVVLNFLILLLSPRVLAGTVVANCKCTQADILKCPAYSFGVTANLLGVEPKTYTVERVSEDYTSSNYYKYRVSVSGNVGSSPVTLRSCAGTSLSCFVSGSVPANGSVILDLPSRVGSLGSIDVTVGGPAPSPIACTTSFSVQPPFYCDPASGGGLSSGCGNPSCARNQKCINVTPLNGYCSPDTSNMCNRCGVRPLEGVCGGASSTSSSCPVGQKCIFVTNVGYDCQSSATCSSSVACGSSGTVSACGVPAGCAIGERCTVDNSSGMPDYVCTPDSTCSSGGYCTEAEARANACGVGCPSDELCTKVTSTQFTCQKNTFRCGSSCTTDAECVARRGPGYVCAGSPRACVLPTPPSPIGRYTGPLTSFTELLQSAYTLLYPIGLGIGAFFILLSGYCFMTSEGEPQAIKGCQEQFTGAIAGTLFILLSITLLRVIIGSILGVPGGF